MTIGRLGLKIKVTNQGQGFRLELSINRRHVFIVASSAARQHGEACGVSQPKPAAVVESSTCGRGKAIDLTSILDRGQFFYGLNVQPGLLRVRPNSSLCKHARRYSQGNVLLIRSDLSLSDFYR